MTIATGPERSSSSASIQCVPAPAGREELAAAALAEPGWPGPAEVGALLQAGGSTRIRLLDEQRPRELGAIAA